MLYGMFSVLVVVTICMFDFSQTLNPSTTCSSKQSSVSSNRSLSFMPMPEGTNGSTLIWLQTSNRTNYLKWKSNLEHQLENYYTPEKIENVETTPCSYGKKPLSGEVCEVNVGKWEPCTRDNYFSYHKAAPCIFLKLNGLHEGWEPQYYNDPDDLPVDMPRQLKDHIRFNFTNPLERNNVWVSCGGEFPVDVEYLGFVEYYPSIQGFPGYYFPYMKTKGYLSPLLAIQFKRPAIGIVINIECRAWAKNIKYNKNERSGYVHFELLVD